MKSPLRKLGLGFGLHPRRTAPGSAAPPAVATEDELLHAAQDLIDMRNCYDSLLSAAAATANSAYEFSEALREMGTCLFARMTCSEDEKAGSILLMLGKTQFQLQKLVDNYRINVLQTITAPSESLLRELQIVEEMKQKCDAKKEKYDSMVIAHKEKGRSKHKGDNVSLEQLKQVQEDYQEETDVFLLRLKSLKHGQPRCLLTQVARHHAAQLNFFEKGFKSLEVVEPHVKLAAEQQHIDYHFTGLADDTAEDDNDDSYNGSRDGELSFDYRRNYNLVEAEDAASHLKEDSFDRRAASPTRGEKLRPGSQSAPLLAENLEATEKLKEFKRSSTRKFCSYALPTPVDVLNQTASGNLSGAALDKKRQNILPFSNVEPNAVKDQRENKLLSPTRLPKAESVLKESNANSIQAALSPPLNEDAALQNCNVKSASDTKKVKGEMFWSANSNALPVRPRRASTSQRPSSIILPPSTSPPPISSPKISELHELPRPPINTATPALPPSSVHHSAPLTSKNQENCRPSRVLPNASLTASPLPAPPGVMARSYSIPSRSPRTPTDANDSTEVIIKGSPVRVIPTAGHGLCLHPTVDTYKQGSRT